MVSKRILLWPLIIALAGALVMAACKTGSPGPSGDYKGTQLSGQAQEFRLTDQHGNGIALTDFRGDVVVLAFLDPRCTDVCPLTALHFRLARERLGQEATRVAFLAVNMNPEAGSVADVAAATEKWGLGNSQRWHFLTGSVSELEPVWKEYHIATGPKSGKPGEVEHTPGVYVIDPTGGMRWYISTPLTEGDATTGLPPLSDLLVRHIQDILRK